MKYILIFVFIFNDKYHNIWTNTQNHYPVILIPGYGGSKAFSFDQESNKTELLWIGLKYIIFPQLLTKEFKLHRNRSFKKSQKTVFFPGWGSTETIENLSYWSTTKTKYFQDIVNLLLQIEYYKKNRTLRGAPYDFRKAPSENKHFIEQFPKLVEDTYEKSNKTKVVLIAHSLGSLYVLHSIRFMSSTWKRKYIRSFVAIGAPIGGCVKALLLELSGYSFGTIRKEILFRELERSFTSTSYLLPRPGIFSNSQILVRTNQNSYSAFDYYDLFRHINFLEVYEMFRKSLYYYNVNRALEGIENLYCIHGKNVNTPQQLIYSQNIFDEIPQIIYGDGDGTVNLESLRLCSNWKNIHYFTIENTNHKNILADPRLFYLIMPIIKDSIS